MATFALGRTEAAWPRAGIGWATVTLLTLAYILSYVDRSILSLLVQPIKADLRVTDEAMGLLIGPAFGVFYATVGLPLGWLADRRRRTTIVAVGVALWSAATVASGLARQYGHLFLARMGVGIGEAALSPCAMSLIADNFPPERRGLPVGVYSSALSLGAGIASLIGAWVLTLTAHGAPPLPFVGTVAPWQFALIAVGLPGLLLAPLFLLLPEPVRRTAGTAPAGFAQGFAAFGSNFGSLGGVTILVAVMTTIAYSHGFIPAAFARTYGWEAKDFARVNGLISLVVGPLTVIAVGWLIDRLRRGGRRDAAFVLLAAGFVPMLPTSALPLFMPNATAGFVMMALSTVCIATVTSAGIVALLDIAPGEARGQLVALYYMTISIAGLFLGPTTVGSLSTRVFGEANLRYAIAVVPILYGLVPLFLLPAIARAYRRRLAEAA